MSLSIEEMEFLQGKGLSLADVIEFAKLAAASRQPKDRTAAERQARHRAKVKGQNTRDVTRDVTRDPPNDIYSNPPVSPSVSDETLLPVEQKPDEIAEAVEVWNETATEIGLPTVRGKLTGQRRARLKARLAEHGLEGMREAVAAVKRSPFCRGEVNDFRADLGFLTRPDNFAKLLEGGFEPRNGQQRTSGPAPPGSFIAAMKREREWRRGASQ